MYRHLYRQNASKTDAMKSQILKLNKAGNPTSWVDYEAAATTIAKGLVLWSMGDASSVLRGGTSRVTGERSLMEIPPIIAVTGAVKEKSVPRISNRLLFARDGYVCLYCGNQFRSSDLSRDHVIPRAQDGIDDWTNCVTACRRCNHRKADRTPEQAGMELLAIPFAPNLYEWFYLSNRNVLADQQAYLQSKFENVIAA